MPAGRPRSKTLTMGEWRKAMNKWTRVVKALDKCIAGKDAIDEYYRAHSEECTFCYRFTCNENEVEDVLRCPLAPKFCYGGAGYYHYTFADCDSTKAEFKEARKYAGKILARIRRLEPGKVKQQLKTPENNEFKVGDRVISLKQTRWVPRKGTLGTVDRTSPDGDAHVKWDGLEDWWVSDTPLSKYIALAPKEKPKVKTPKNKEFEIGARVISLGKRTFIPRKGGLGTVEQVGDDNDLLILWDNGDSLWTCEEEPTDFVALVPKKVKKVVKTKKVKKFEIECPICELMVEKVTDSDGYITCPACESEFLP